MANSQAPRLPRDLTVGGSSVAVISRQISAGVLAHKSSSQNRENPDGTRGRSRQVTHYVAACAVDQPDEADEAYLVSAAWADHLGAEACTEAACFPETREG